VVIALYGHEAFRRWRWIYAVTAGLAVAYTSHIRSGDPGFLGKLPALHALAPGEPPGGPVFVSCQLIVLVLFVIVLTALPAI